MEADFEGALEDMPPADESENDDEPAEGDEDRLPQEMGDVGNAGETVDERLWGEEDKPEEGQQGLEKYERDAAVQVTLILSRLHPLCAYCSRGSSHWIPATEGPESLVRLMHLHNPAWC